MSLLLLIIIQKIYILKLQSPYAKQVKASTIPTSIGNSETHKEKSIFLKTAGKLTGIPKHQKTLENILKNQVFKIPQDKIQRMIQNA